MGRSRQWHDLLLPGDNVIPCRDADLINRFANDPSIRPFIGGKGPLDLTAITQGANVALFGEYGGFCLSWCAPDTYEIHTLILPEGRGQWAFDWAAQSIAYMERLGAIQMWTRVHPDHRHTAIFTRKMGLKPCGEIMTDYGDGPVLYKMFNWRKPCQQQ